MPSNTYYSKRATCAKKISHWNHNRILMKESKTKH